MIYFPDTNLQRYTYTVGSTGIYGEDLYDYEYAETILVDFQNENNAEVRHEYGVDKQNLYKIYMDNSVVLNNSDRLIDNIGNCYVIIGEVQEYKHFHNYKKAHLIKERKVRRVLTDVVLSFAQNEYNAAPGDTLSFTTTLLLNGEPLQGVMIRYALEKEE